MQPSVLSDIKLQSVQLVLEGRPIGVSVWSEASAGCRCDGYRLASARVHQKVELQCVNPSVALPAPDSSLVLVDGVLLETGKACDDGKRTMVVDR